MEKSQKIKKLEMRFIVSNKSSTKQDTINRVFTKKTKSAFTLVELIIVITILAILSTIWFISFQSYVGDARDSNRIATINTINKWLEIYFLKNREYPSPEDIYWTGIYETKDLNYVWFIKESISESIRLWTTPIDPITKDYYLYWVSSDNKNYQLAISLEWKISNTVNILDTTYADKWKKAKVLWHYSYPLKLDNKLYDLPSLLFTWTGWELSNDLDEKVKFIVNNWNNLPHSNNNKETFIESKKIETNNDNIPLITLNWILIPILNNLVIWNKLQNISDKFWINIDSVWKKVYGDNKYSNELKNKLKKWLFLYCKNEWDVIYWTSDLTSEWLNCQSDIYICNSTWTWYAIKACNIWSNQLWTWTINSSWWYRFQWWNNNTFTLGINNSNTWWYLADISNNWPNNYYSSWTFLINNIWFSWIWTNLWGYIDNTNLSKKWPCEYWYHVPSTQEWINLLNLKWDKNNLNDYQNLHKDLYIPIARYLDWATGQNYWSTEQTHLWTSEQWKALMIHNTPNINIQSRNTSNWYPIRCFKNL